MRINIHAPNVGGLSTDLDVLETVLGELGHTVWFRGKPRRQYRGVLSAKLATLTEVARRHSSRAARSPIFDLNIHIEVINEHHVSAARRNVLLPHPEWFRPHNEAHRHLLDEMWAKTHDSVARLGTLGTPTRYVGFTSPDAVVDDRSGFPEDTAFLHVAGHSHLKGTVDLVRLWARHPEWPALTVVGDLANGTEADRALRADAHNIHHRRDRISPSELHQLRLSHPIHVQPSVCEGYGHVVNEATSYGRLIVTTDAAPMNELVDQGAGLLVAVRGSMPLNRGDVYTLDEADLERCIQTAIDLPASERARRGAEARNCFLRRSAEFRLNLERAIGKLFSRSTGPVIKE